MTSRTDRAPRGDEPPVKERRLPAPYTSSLCPNCGRDTIHHTLRTSATLYHRCVSCGGLWDRAREESTSRRKED